MTQSAGSLIGFILAVWVILNVAVAGVWDLYCLFSRQPADWYLSSYLSRWAHDFPVGVLAVGVLIGHLVWQMTQPGPPPPPSSSS